MGVGCWVLGVGISLPIPSPAYYLPFFLSCYDNGTLLGTWYDVGTNEGVWYDELAVGKLVYV